MYTQNKSRTNTICDIDTADPAALLDRLKACERRGNYEAALLVLSAMVDIGEWKVVLDTGERWLKSTDPHFVARPEWAARGVTVQRLQSAPTGETWAARAANAFRLLAPVAGKAWIALLESYRGDDRLHTTATGWERRCPWSVVCLGCRAAAEVQTDPDRWNNDRASDDAPWPPEWHAILRMQTQREERVVRKACTCEAVPNPLPRYVEALRLWRPDGWFEWINDSLAISWHFAKITINRSGVVTCGETCPSLPEVPMEE